MPLDGLREDDTGGPPMLARWILGDARQIVLASRSPRRREILETLGVPVRTAPAEIDETFLPGEDPAAGASRVASLKVAAVRREFGGALILGADTVVVVDGAVFGKPAGDADARRMLRTLAGRSHRVVTGIALARGDGATRVAAESTQVVFRDLTDREIDEYVATAEPLDKAGAYGIQGQGALLVREVRGDYLNVVGLPLYRLLELARALRGERGAPGRDRFNERETS
ncbi:MAG: Maf family protein [bacterium]